MAKEVLAGLRLKDAGHQLEQGGFARAIGTDQPEPFSFSDVEIEIGKEGADAEILGRTHQADQTHGVPAGS